MRLVFFGTSEFAIPSLEALVRARHEILLVMTQPARPAGRGRQPHEPPVKLAADAMGLLTCQSPSPNRSVCLTRIEHARPDLLVVAAYGRLLKPVLLEIPRLGAINLHGSLLPSYRGAAPIQRAIMAGETQTGVTTMWMAPEMDTGDIILQRRVPIAPEDTAGTLSEKLAAAGAELLVETLERVAAGTAPRTPQDEAEATYAPPVTRADARINWAQTAGELVNLVRGSNPKPGAFTACRGEMLKVWQAEEVKNGPLQGGRAGEIVEIADDGVVVQAGEGGLRLRRVQPESRRGMSAGEYVRGRRIGVGEVLG